MCHEAGLFFDELKYMNLSNVFERIYKYIDLHNSNNKKQSKPKGRKATQADIEAFF